MPPKRLVPEPAPPDSVPKAALDGCPWEAGAAGPKEVRLNPRELAAGVLAPTCPKPAGVETELDS